MTMMMETTMKLTWVSSSVSTPEQSEHTAAVVQQEVHSSFCHFVDGATRQ